MAVVYQAAGHGERPPEEAQKLAYFLLTQRVERGRNVPAHMQLCRPKHCPARSECAKKPAYQLGIDLPIYPAIASPIEPEIDLDPPAGQAAQQR
jgi:hypothetical protein